MVTALIIFIIIIVVTFLYFSFGGPKLPKETDAIIDDVLNSLLKTFSCIRVVPTEKNFQIKIDDHKNVQIFANT
ncbi:hypothetical protein [Evansella halocellulosilytica]|uniref:hypothetical protein n=1 Tax=Evansella halocellulosilytica TaxID=2011013 RepID=UPI000BB83FCA|nr:hypothetical protein [Evansella halocellulosilytica]